MADPGSSKYLSYAGILAVAANTMNGPAFTTLPDVAADAGLGLYVALIAVFVAMAAYVCRRLVYAIWSSLDEDDIDAEAGNYGAADTNSGGSSVKSLAIASSESKVGEEVAGVDEIIPDATSGKEGVAQLTHREHDDEEEGSNEVEALIKEHPKTKNKTQPSLDNTSIVGQSLEAYGEKGGYYAALGMVASAFCLALAQMMLCAGVVDEMFVALGGKSCAIGWPSSFTDDEGVTTSSWIHCSTHASMKPFMDTGAPTSLISVGWFVGASASVAMGTVDLDDLISLQYFLFGCLVLAATRFSFVLSNMGKELSEGSGGDSLGRMLVEEEAGDGSAVEWFVGPNPFQTIGPIMFNFAFIVTSPSSVCLAKKDTTAYKALGMACVAMGTMYAMVGVTGATVSNAVRNGMIKGESDSNLLSLIMMSGGENGCSMLDLSMIALFGFSTVASIPVYCLLAKETLITDAGVGKLPAFLLSNVLPWAIVALTYNAAFFDAFVNWSGLCILGYTNFSMPLLLDLKLKSVRAARAMGKKMISSDDEMATKITKIVMTLVTASITAVIVISISDSLISAAVAFLITAGLVAHVKV